MGDVRRCELPYTLAELDEPPGRYEANDTVTLTVKEYHRLLVTARCGVEANEDAERLDWLEANPRPLPWLTIGVSPVYITISRAKIDEWRAVRVPETQEDD